MATAKLGQHPREQDPDDAVVCCVQADTVNTLRAVLHQMDHGNASDFIDADTYPFDHGTQGAEENDARRDLVWCREELRTLLRNMEGGR